MQISQRILWASVTATLLFPLASSAQDATADAKLEHALEQKMKELDATKPPPPVVPPPAPPKNPAPPKKSEPVYQPLPGTNPPPVHMVTQPVQPKPAEPTTSAAQQMSRDAAIAEAVQEANASQAKANQPAKATPPTAKPSASHNSQAAAASRPPLVFPTMQGPPSSLNGTQQSRLQALDQQYATDQISSEQYHAQRAKIIAEP